MDDARERALTLAHDAGIKWQETSPADIVERARISLGFLTGTRDIEIVNAARILAEKVKRLS